MARLRAALRRTGYTWLSKLFDRRWCGRDGKRRGRSAKPFLEVFEDRLLPAATFSVDHPVVVEGTGGTTDLVYTITLAGDLDLAVTAAYSTADGTATAGADYTATSGTLTFAPGPTTQAVSV